MLTEDTNLMRALRPKITPAALVRRHIETAANVAFTSATLSLTWWHAYIDGWARVMFPDSYRRR